MLGLLFPRARIEVLTVVLRDPSASFYLREIARLCDLPVRAVQREVALYEAMELLARVPRGRQVFFRVRTDHPLFLELRALVLKARGLVPEGAAATSPPPPRAPDTAPPSPAPRQVRQSDTWRVW
jgi:hypothetical protein